MTHEQTASDVMSRLVYEQTFGWWRGPIVVDGLSDCRILWSTSDNDIEPREPDPESDAHLVVEAKDGHPPTEAQRAAVEYLLSHQAEIARAVLEFAVDEMTFHCAGETFPLLEECSEEDRVRWQRFETVEGFRELVELNWVGVFDLERDGLAFTAFDFGTPLDEEHGFGVHLSGSRVVGWGECLDRTVSW